MDDLKSRLVTLNNNLNLLREREARYGGNAPLELVNQIDDHLTAIQLVQQTIDGQLTVEELDDKLLTLNLALTRGSQISVGDVEGSYVAIGDGARLIVNKALSAAEEAKAQQDLEQVLLAQAVVNLGTRLQQVVARKPKTDELSNPYKALLDYRLEDAALFYGRSQAIEQMLAHLDRNPLTVLHAESGAGKTSLLQAGLASRLLVLGDLPLHIRPWKINPALAVKRTILPNLANAPGLAEISLFDFLHRVTQILGEDSYLYIFLDQFEEFFTQLGEESRQDFVNQLGECLEDESLRVRWVLALRKEYFGNLATFRPQIKNPFANDYLLRAMNRAEATEVIVEPAKKQGVTYEPEVVEQLLNDLSSNHDAGHQEGEAGEVAPPQIQLVCSTLFEKFLEKRQARAELPPSITLEMYKAEGGAQGILRGHLNRVLQRTLSQKERELARQLLMALVSSDQRRVRRGREELAATLALYLTGGQSLDDILEQLVESRLLKVEEDEETNTTAYELAHDYLLTEIQVDPETQAQKAAQELLTRELESFRRYRTVLSPDKYDIINSQRQFLVLDDESKELLRLSQAARTRRLRQVATVAVVIIAILSGLVWWALISRNQAVVERDRAEQASQIAQARQLAAEAQNLVNTDSELSLLLALESLDLADIIEAEDTLRMVLPFIRDWWSLDTRSEGVSAAAWNIDGTRVALGLDNGDIQIWDVETETMLSVLKGHPQPVTDLEFNPRGTHLLSAADDPDNASLRLWDVATGETVALLKGHPAGASGVAWNHDGSRALTTGGTDIILWDMTTLQPLATLSEHTGQVFDVAWQPVLPENAGAGEQKFASVGEKGEIFIWNLATLSVETELDDYPESITSVSWNPDGIRLATGSAEGAVYVWDTVEGHILDVLTGHTGRVRSVDWHPEGRWLASGSGDTRMIIWDVEASRSIIALTGHNNWVQQVHWDPTGDYILSASKDGTARIWNVEDSPAMVTLLGHVGQARGIAWHPAGHLLASTGDDGTLRLWNPDSGEAVDNLDAHDEVAYSVAWSADGAKLATASEDHTVRLWSTVTLEPLAVILEHPAAVNWVVWSPDSQTLATAGNDHVVRLWDAQTGALKQTLNGHTKAVHGLAFSPDGAQLASGSADASIIIWDSSSGEKLQTLTDHTDFVWDIKFSPVLSDGTRYLASASQDKTVRIWDPTTGKSVAVYAHQKPVNGVAWKSDGLELATASDDGLARIWDVERAEIVATFSGHQGGVLNIAWSADDARLATASTDGVVRVFDADLEEILALANQYKHRDLTDEEFEQFSGEAVLGVLGEK
ncbi:MAG: hypothetical protein JXM69_14920 [Anaerolineae bacterium]|nr:hypothetical protein [Anaerolineae bacterium]